MADWDRLLTFVITPKSGPWRKMVDLMTSGKPLSPEFDAMVAALEEKGGCRQALLRVPDRSAPRKLSQLRQNEAREVWRQFSFTKKTTP